jgi:SAM-dependent methyltransferase
LRERLPRRLRPLVRPGRLGRALRLRPVSDHWGYDRGVPVDRRYIEWFLDSNRHDIRGRVLEVKDAGYTTRFGSGVTHVDVLDIDEGNPAATIVADLSAADSVPSESYDCIVLTQVLQYIADVSGAVTQIRRLLAPAGVALVTLPSISRVTDQQSALVDYWRFTAASARLLFTNEFGEEDLSVTTFGNPVAATAFLLGLAAEELTQRELAWRDERYPVVVAIRAVR